MEIGVRVANRMKEMGVTTAAVCRKTGITPGKLYPSLAGKREFRADEFLAICQFLKLDPWEAAGQISA